MSSITIGTRGSTLALAQATWVKRQLEQQNPQVAVDLRIIKTSGDRFFETPVLAIGGKGIFVKEIEDALLRSEIDLAVHSMKDLPTELAAGLTIAAVPKREDARDALVSRNRLALKDLPESAKVATGSLRRRAQIAHYRSDFSLVPIRGNIDTRLKKLAAGEMDALVLAAAGLNRIGQEHQIAEFLDSKVCVSAVAQGALALETRDDGALREELRFMHHQETYSEVLAERTFLDRLGGGCHVPVGALAKVSGDRLEMSGVVADPEGRVLCRGEIVASTSQAAAAGKELAERLLAEGAAAILAAG
ncbi:MAG: hydroxymethylbilane synthase [Candidatus Binatia bacterium]